MATVTLIPRPQPGDTEAGAEHADVTAVNRKGERSLYAGRKKVYSKLASGFFRRTKWLLLALTLGIYYLLPWLRWDRGPDMPDQAVLLDLQHERFFFFFLEIWPQEFYFVTGLLVLASLALFLVTVARRPGLVRLLLPADGVDRPDDRGRALLAGRPQRAHAPGQGGLGRRETLQEGGDPPHLAADRPPHRRRLGVLLRRRADAVLAAGDPAGAAGRPTSSSPCSPRTTYLLGGIAREQVCIYMCPWPRIQGALVDKDSFPRLLPRTSRRAARLLEIGGELRQRRSATASTARPASPSARSASTSATARSSNASSARSASMPATTSCERSAGRQT